MKSLSNLWVTQGTLREYDQLPQMTDFVRNGGFWTQEALDKYNGKPTPLIQISRFEDGQEYIHDGHHRLIATWLAGRYELDDSEYQVKEYTYARYMTAKPQMLFFTPFDPRIHIRKSDFAEFRAKAIYIHQNTPDMLEDWIKEHENEYRETRDVWTITQVIDKLSLKGDK